MNNLEYVTSLIKSNDRIYIDTSALMNVEELELMAENIQEILVSEKKRIIVPRAVCMELVRHFESSDERKKSIALKVFDVFCKYDRVFSVQNSEIGDTDIMKVFADAKLLAELTENKSRCKQLLITNDRKLGHDAYDLNRLESCKGHTIKVCYLNKFGELHRCECVKAEQTAMQSSEPQIVTKEVIKVVTVKEKPDSDTWITKVAVPVATMVAGYIAGKYGNDMIKYIKKIA